MDDRPLAHVIRRLGREPLLFPPGTDYAYSNASFYLAGHLVARGLTYFRAPLNERTVLRPWSQTTFFNPHDPYTRISFERGRAGKVELVFHRPAYKRFPPMRERLDRVG